MGIFKKQWFAWLAVLVMVALAVGAGQLKHRTTPSPSAGSGSALQSYVYDDAHVLSSSTREQLDRYNQQLIDDYGVVVGVVTCNYGKDDLFDYALSYAEQIGLGGYDMIVALDISGDNYWLLQGAGLAHVFTDDDCSEYAYRYLERGFAVGNYDSAVLSLMQGLSDWYRNYYQYEGSHDWYHNHYQHERNYIQMEALFTIIVLIVVLLAVIEGSRRRRYFGGFYGPNYVYRPFFIFPPRPPRPPHFGPRPGASPRPGAGPRPGGTFGGASLRNSFSGGRPSGGAGRTGSSFSSRSSFGGGRSSGGGSFGGGRSGGGRSGGGRR